ncbi:hypothetical protein [Shimia sp. Alg240-R146]|uniref:hypothetical protein n=1 Tax=Shimia sp. Alg240-R146 TaxID=2993449 RepID=UPI0022E8D744|nr:hypothetical protein [Shimia sp. Alg240-R146]
MGKTSKRVRAFSEVPEARFPSSNFALLNNWKPEICCGEKEQTLQLQMISAFATAHVQMAAKSRPVDIQPMNFTALYTNGSVSRSTAGLALLFCRLKAQLCKRR